jgi:hypothetical protein
MLIQSVAPCQVQLQDLTLRQHMVIQNSLLHGLPTQALRDIIKDIAEHPKEYEKKGLEEVVVEASNNSKTKCAFSDQNKKTREEEVQGGFFSGINIDYGGTESKNNENQIPLDGIYVSQLPNSPKFIASQSLNGFPKEQIQIGPEFPNARKLRNYLIREHDWIGAQLRKIYHRIGENQRKFIATFNPLDIHPYTRIDIGEETGLHGSTVGKLISSRFVALKKGKENYAFPTKELLLGIYDFKRYLSAPRINELLELEFEAREALSDQAFTETIQGKIIARRTFTKYRKNTGIPSRGERQKSYSSGDKKEPYVIKLGFESWLPGD